MNTKEELREIAQAMMSGEAHVRAGLACIKLEQIDCADTEISLGIEAYKRAKARLNKLIPPASWEVK